MFAVRVELQHCPCPNAQALIKRLEKFAATFEGVVAFTTRDAKPLNRGDADCPVKDPRPKFPTLSNIHLPKSPSRLLFFRRYIKHITADIDPFPNEPVFLNRFA